MNKIAKLLKKISKKEREALLNIIESLLKNPRDKKLNIKKLQNSNFYRLRKGNFRVIFHYENKDVIIDSVKS